MILQETSPKHSKRLPLLVPIYSFAWLVPVLLSCFLMSLPFDLAEATRHLSSCDEKLAALIAETAPFQTDMDSAQSPYEALLESIAYQSISGTKVLAMKDLARKTIEGIVPTRQQAEKMSDEELVQRLDSVRGIGAWTVEMFLIFNLGRPDVLPIHDLGVQKGWSVAYGKKHMPKPKELLAFGERWRPYRTVASWYMWRALELAGDAITNKYLPAKVKAPKRPKPTAIRTNRRKP